MARLHAQIFTRIWRDEDFIRLSSEAQRLYFLLLSQSNLNYAGVLPLQERRWARFSAGSSVEEIGKAILELETAAYVVVDRDTEELLVRSFIRNDGLWRSPNVLKSALNDAQETHSTALRRTLADELERIDFSPVGENRARALQGQVRPAVAALRGTLPETPSETLPGTLPETPSGTSEEPFPEPEGVGVGVGEGVTGGSSVSVDAPASKDRRSRSPGKQKRATAAPDTFDIDDALRHWASTKGLRFDLERETDRFLDHHRAKGSTFKDWRAAWRTWMDRAADYGGAKPKPAAGNPQTAWMRGDV